MEFLAKLLDVLRNVPLWLTGSVASACLFILYGPTVHGLPVEAARAWPFFGVVTVFAIAFTIGQLVAIICRAAIDRWKGRQGSVLTMVCDERRNFSFWAATKKPDGSATTQIHLRLSVHNAGTKFARIVKVSIRRPMFITEAQVLSIMFQAPTQIGGHTYDSKGYLFSGQSADCNIDAIIGRNLGRKNKPLRVRFDLIDEKAKAHRVTATLLPN